MSAELSPSLSLASILRRYREEAQLTQEALAEHAGLTAEAISLLERGSRRRPHADTLQRIADALALTRAQRTALNAAARPTGTPRRSTSPTRPPLDGLLAPFTTLVGREQELDIVTALLSRPELRLLTLTGPGGVGKTRLALQVAKNVQEQYADGLTVVSLAPLSDYTLLVVMLAQQMGVVSGGGQTLRESLVAFLQDKQMLLILDNFEHIIAAAPVVAEIIAVCPVIKILVTSRVPLHLSAEQIFSVPSLAIDTAVTDPAILAGSSAIMLFEQRARAADPSFAVTLDLLPTLAAICARLDGLPLAIELAAARITSLPPRALLGRIDKRLPLLTGGGPDKPERHQTLSRAIAWSYDLLNLEQQCLFRRLCIFAGGGELTAAEVICTPEEVSNHSFLDTLRALVDANLVRVSERAEIEVRIELLETVREYGREQLEASGEWPEMQARHALYYLTLAETTEPELRGPRQVHWLDRLEAEHDNLRAVLQWTLADSTAPLPMTSALDESVRQIASRSALGLLLACALSLFWFRRGHLEEGQHWLAALLQAAASNPTALDPAAHARALRALGVLAINQSGAEQSLSGFMHG